ncbi:helix-turn-helix domain-containing protein [Globicatella sulfidifaciens]|uniref:helix-turn-helix domain-containing protein n=1 Tax=Globicatella sulfidifaciens TaxID=136093 RepID=UPI0028921250|nr:helix-turn-helix transcriptional regulator [Globicatella sulfidifaciens]MDT2767707.1 helix-turn-helix transcriptional regulator [Globicatella sulfidifaciens]
MPGENIKLPEQISFYRNKMGWTQEQLAEKIGVSKQSVSNWETGLKSPRMKIISKLASLFNVNISDLVTSDTEEPYYKINEREKIDIGKEVDKLIEGLYTNAEVNFYGEPMDEESKDSLRMAIQMAMELNKEKAKKKFTPKKYRDE